MKHVSERQRAETLGKFFVYHKDSKRASDESRMAFVDIGHLLHPFEAVVV